MAMQNRRLLDGCADSLKGLFNEFSDHVALSSGQYKVIGLILLQHHPHSFHVVASMAPITFGIDVSEVQTVTFSEVYFGNSASNLSSHKRTTTAGTFMVKEDAINGEHVIRFAIVDDNPIRIQFRHTIRRARVKGRCLGLRCFHNLSIQLAGGCLGWR